MVLLLIALQWMYLLKVGIVALRSTMCPCHVCQYRRCPYRTSIIGSYGSIDTGKTWVDSRQGDVCYFNFIVDNWPLYDRALPLQENFCIDFRSTCLTSTYHSHRFELYLNSKLCYDKFSCVIISWQAWNRKKKCYSIHLCLIVYFQNIMEWYLHLQINGLVQKRCNSIANALELRLSCINPFICCLPVFGHHSMSC